MINPDANGLYAPSLTDEELVEMYFQRDIPGVYRQGQRFKFHGYECIITVVRDRCFDFIFADEIPWQYKNVNGYNRITFWFAKLYTNKKIFFYY